MPAWGKAVIAALAARSVWAESDSKDSWVSAWGTEKAVTLPHYLIDNPMPKGQPWGSRSVKSNQYQETPNTGVTRHYEWTITKGACSPDGFANTCLLINGQFVGPLLEANWGDYFEVKVTNLIPDEGTTIHWHGLLQKNTPYMDGLPGVTQCPIAPNKTFTYRFQADLYGSSWYHSHWSAQYGSGLFGPIAIYGPKNVQYDDDLGPIMISDYYHSYYFDLVEQTLANPNTGNPGPPLADNNLINGKTNNGGSYATFRVQSGKTYRMRVINPSAASVQKFTIDGYNFTVFANDFVPVVPYVTDVLTLGVGQRNDIVFKATGSPTDAVWMRGYRPPPCGPSAANEEVLAAIYYENADTSVSPTTQAGPNAYDQYCGNDPLTQTVPEFSLTPPNPDLSQNIALDFRSNGTALLWYMNNRTFFVDYNDPMLLETKLGNADKFPALRNAHIYPGSINSIRFVIENPVNQPHPMHLHGHNIWVLQEGSCTSVPGEEVQGSPGQGPPSPSQTGQGPPSQPTGGPPSGPPDGPPGGEPPSNPSKRGSNDKLRIHYDVNSKRATPPKNSCWDGSIVNPNNPQRRDVQMLPAQSYIVIQWLQDNPGVWPLHCHIAWHLSAGMSWMVVENPTAVEKEMNIPSIMAETCRTWSAYSGDHVVEQIDDGI